jgi:excinuclease ABC subunit C
METSNNKIKNLPKSPGVYEFRDKQGKILYIGKATSLKDRAGSYFSKNAHLDRPNIEPMISQITDIKVRETDSVLEALILESNLIKKHQPKYNIEGKDDKSFAYVVITKEEYPRILIVRKTELQKFPISNFQFPTKSQIQKSKILNTRYKIPYTKTYGPYTSKKQLEIALKIIRKIFPYHSAKQVSRNCCFDHQIGLCPGPHAGAISKKDYLKNIRGVKMTLEGKKKSLIGKLKKEMGLFSKKRKFEKAAEARNRIFALNHIRDVALISEDMDSLSLTLGLFPKVKLKEKVRIEAYDISNIGGDFAVGSMVVFTNGKPDKSQYRKFKIKTVSGIDDVAMMREILCRRFNNTWPKPDLILLDGGKGHLNMAQRILKALKLEIPIIAVAKGPTRKKLDMYHGKEALIFQDIINDEKLVERIREEAHRFAISYHKILRGKNWKQK